VASELAPVEALRVFVLQNAYCRLPNLAKRRELTSNRYKKGWEVRVIVTGPDIADEVRALAREAGFRAGRAFAKGNLWAVPIYGVEAVEAFQDELGVTTEPGSAEG
jgi:hypothetical protein